MKTINRIICSLLLASACSIGAIAQENQSYFLHTIEKGQSLYSIASMYGVSQSDIIKLNPGSDEKIFIGRTLRIPRSAGSLTLNIQKTYKDQNDGIYKIGIDQQSIDIINTTQITASVITDDYKGLWESRINRQQLSRIGIKFR